MVLKKSFAYNIKIGVLKTKHQDFCFNHKILAIMIFKRLNYQTLQSLHLQGYNILLTIGSATDENPIYLPLKLESFTNINEAFVRAEDSKLQGHKILVLEEAIRRSLNNDINGVVQLEH